MMETYVSTDVETDGPIPSTQLGALAPFLGRATLTRLVDRLQEDSLNADSLAALAPFLDRETLTRIVLRLPQGRSGAPALAALAPFLDQSTLESLHRGQTSPPSA